MIRYLAPAVTVFCLLGAPTARDARPDRHARRGADSMSKTRNPDGTDPSSCRSAANPRG